MPSHSPLISVIVPSFNRAHLLPETIENILQQSFEDFELIIVNDGSTDETDAAVAPFLDRITYLKHENKGITGARNTGIRAAKGEWIALQDSDDHWQPNKLQQHIVDMEANPGFGVYFLEAILQRSHLDAEVASYQQSGFAEHLNPEGCTVIDRPLSYHIRFGVAWVQTTLIRKRVLFDVGLYDEWLTLFTDFDLFCRLALAGPWFFHPKPLVKIQRVGDENANVSSQRTQMPAKPYRNMAYILEKLRHNDELDAQERETVTERLYHAYSGLGNELGRLGDTAGARSSFSRALGCKLKLGAAVKYAATVLKKQKVESEFRPRMPIRNSV